MRDDYALEYKRFGKTALRMDPDCAVCHSPANLKCSCEAKGLDKAIQQAEEHVMSESYEQVRSWVRNHAQDYILRYFTVLKEGRTQHHKQHMEALHQYTYRHFNAPPNQADIDNARAALKHGIDQDWQMSVQRYPEVLEYYFGLVSIQLPSEDAPHIRSPPLEALSGRSKGVRRAIQISPVTVVSGGGGDGGGGGANGAHGEGTSVAPPAPLPPPPTSAPGMIAYLPHHQHTSRDVVRRSQPPPPPPSSDRTERRAPGPPVGRRSLYRQPIEQAPASYYGY